MKGRSKDRTPRSEAKPLARRKRQMLAAEAAPQAERPEERPSHEADYDEVMRIARQVMKKYHKAFKMLAQS